MAETRCIHRVEVHTTGPLTLEEVQRFVNAARYHGVPETAVVVQGGASAAAQVLTVAHDFEPPAALPPPPPRPGRRPSIGNLR